MSMAILDSDSACPALRPDQWEFTVVFRREETGPEIGREPVTGEDMLDPQCELWLDGFLRTGRTDIPLNTLDFHLTPRFMNESQRRCHGFVLRASEPTGTAIEREYPLESFLDIMSRGRQRLIAAKTVRAAETVYYEVVVEQRDRSIRGADEELFEIARHDPPLRILSVPLRELLDRSRMVGTGDALFPVFYTEEALARAEQFARRGAAANPPIETGGVIVGPLCSCPETGEFFAVACQVFEVADAREGKFSLSYTATSWARIQNIVKAMQSQPTMGAYRLLGQCHGHNFPAGGGAPPCDQCHLVQVCSRTSVFVSLDDRLWSQAVFSRQPWQLCHIFGTNARKENVQSLFTLRENRLLERGFHVIPEFQPLGDWIPRRQV